VESMTLICSRSTRLTTFTSFPIDVAIIKTSPAPFLLLGALLNPIHDSERFQLSLFTVSVGSCTRDLRVCEIGPCSTQVLQWKLSNSSFSELKVFRSGCRKIESRYRINLHVDIQLRPKLFGLPKRGCREQRDKDRTNNHDQAALTLGHCFSQKDRQSQQMVLLHRRVESLMCFLRSVQIRYWLR